MTAKNDKPKVHATVASLGGESTSEPFVLALTGNKRITFHNPEDMEWSKAEELARLASSGTGTVSELFEAWLTEKDFEAFKAQKLTLRQVVDLAEQVGTHFAEFFNGEEA